MKYIKIELLKTGRLSIKETNDPSWLNQYYHGIRVELGMTCLKENKDNYIKKIVSKQLKEINQEMSVLLRRKTKIEKLLK